MSKWDTIINGGADIAPQDAGEWREMKNKDHYEEEIQSKLFEEDEVEIYSQLPEGVY